MMLTKILVTYLQGNVNKLQTEILVEMINQFFVASEHTSYCRLVSYNVQSTEVTKSRRDSDLSKKQFVLWRKLDSAAQGDLINSRNVGDRQVQIEQTTLAIKKYYLTEDKKFVTKETSFCWTIIQTPEPGFTPANLIYDFLNKITLFCLNTRCRGDLP